MLSQKGWLQNSAISLIELTQNTGGAGGFSTGLQKAIEYGAEWIWMMDDDAEPHATALHELMKIANNPKNIYGSLAVNKSDTSWLTTVVNPPLGIIDTADKIPSEAEVQFLPFLGFLIHRDLVKKIGLPDAGFFIAADDVEYCIRAQNFGAKIIVAGHSRIEHPKSHTSQINIFGKKIFFLSLPPWKRYYDTRNRLLIARKHYGFRFFTQTIPGSILRFFIALIKEPQKLAQSRAFIAGFIDGVMQRKGKRHVHWGIK